MSGANWRDGADLSTVKWPLRGYAPGGYMGKCRECGEAIDGVDKRASSCLKCAIAGASVAPDNQRAEIVAYIDGLAQFEADSAVANPKNAFMHFYRMDVFKSVAKAIEARSDKAGTGLAVGESAVAKPFAQGDQP